MNKLRNNVMIALLIAIALILHIVELIFPITALIPGIKLGLANIVSLLALVIFGFKAGLIIVFFRVILASFLTGTFMTISFYLSISGGLIAYLAMSFVFYYFKGIFSIIGISVIGAAFHNLGQIIVAYFIIANWAIFYYLPYLLLAAIPTGIGIGLITHYLIIYLKKVLNKGVS